ncbi:unnamed protein product, partial [Urochloa humidicola]
FQISLPFLPSLPRLSYNASSSVLDPSIPPSLSQRSMESALATALLSLSPFAGGRQHRAAVPSRVAGIQVRWPWGHGATAASTRGRAGSACRQVDSVDPNLGTTRA